MFEKGLQLSDAAAHFGNLDQRAENKLQVILQPLFRTSKYDICPPKHFALRLVHSLNYLVGEP